MSQRVAIFPAEPHALYEQHGYSPAVRAGDLLFISGQVGALKDGSPEPGLARQAQLAFDNLNAILEAAGGSFADVVDLTVFIVDPEKNLETLFPVIRANFGDKPYPTMTGVGVSWLAGFQFEIKAIAHISAKSR